MGEKTKVIALDVYGTMLPSEGIQSKRKGLDSFLSRYRDSGLTLCTCSDAYIQGVLLDFEEAGLDPKYFDEFFKMERKGKDFTHEPKDFTPIIKHYNLIPQELIVIGDRYERDITPALNMGCKAILVPEYCMKEDNDFDINSILI